MLKKCTSVVFKVFMSTSKFCVWTFLKPYIGYHWQFLNINCLLNNFKIIIW